MSYAHRMLILEEIELFIEHFPLNSSNIALRFLQLDIRPLSNLSFETDHLRGRKPFRILPGAEESWILTLIFTFPDLDTP